MVRYAVAARNNSYAYHFYQLHHKDINYDKWCILWNYIVNVCVTVIYHGVYTPWVIRTAVQLYICLLILRGFPLFGIISETLFSGQLPHFWLNLEHSRILWHKINIDFSVWLIADAWIVYCAKIVKTLVLAYYYDYTTRDIIQINVTILI